MGYQILAKRGKVEANEIFIAVPVHEIYFIGSFCFNSTSFGLHCAGKAEILLLNTGLRCSVDVSIN